MTSALSLTLKEISEQRAPAPHWQWSFQFKVLEDSGLDLTDKDLARTDKEKEGFYTPLTLTNLDFIADYEKGFCDHVNASVMVGGGTWLKVLAPHREHLRVYLTRTRLGRYAGDDDGDSEPLVVVYKPIFKDNSEAHESIGGAQGLSRGELDVRMLLTLDIDLLEPASEAVQAASCGGIWRGVTSADVMQAVFANVCSQMQYEAEDLITSQVIAQRTNPDKREHVSVPSGTPLVDLPMLLQESCGGIWPTGCSRFLHGKTWFFYPCYDMARIEQEEHTLTIVKVPETAALSARHTFLQDGEHLKILAGSESQIQDLTQVNFLSQGDGLRFAKSASVMDDWLELKDNKAHAKRGKSNTEARIKADEQTDHRTFNANTRFTDNPYAQYSALAARRGQLLSFVWSYSDHTLIRPGMACRILYDNGGEVKQLHGVVVGRHAAVQSTQKTAAPGAHLTTTALFVFCNEAPEQA